MMPTTTFYLYSTKYHLNVDPDDSHGRATITEGDKYFFKTFGGIFTYGLQILLFILYLGLLHELYFKGKTICR